MWPKLNTMKHFITLTAFLVSLMAAGQNDPFWNPDANGDDLIGFTDLASLLSVYNSNIGVDSSVTCEFNGTDLEELILGTCLGEIVIDSIYFETTLTGIAYDYALGCPDPVGIPWSVSQSGTAPCQISLGNDYRVFYASFDFCNLYVEAYRDGSSPWYFYSILQSYYSEGIYNANVTFYPVYGTNVPNQSGDVVFDSLGIRQVNMNPNNYVRAVPYWHYAE